jgi:predicted RNA-binding Zn ribbon-like protein
VAEPGDRAPAPEPIRLAQRFINTIDLEEADADSLPAFLAECGLETISPRELERALELREALRELVVANAGLPHDTRAIDVVNAAGERAGLRPRLTGAAASTLAPEATGLDAALGRIVAAVHAGIADGSWARLKACERETCRWAYYDHSRNRSGHWCTMAVCGAREKNKRAYRRRRAATG